MAERIRCDAVVWRRDTYRVSRDGTGRKFRMHYTRTQCRRWAACGDLCRQHAEMPGVPLWTKPRQPHEAANA